MCKRVGQKEDYPGYPPLFYLIGQAAYQVPVLSRGYEYALVSAYSTIKSTAGQTECHEYRRLSIPELERMNSIYLLFSYKIIIMFFRDKTKLKLKT